MAKIQLTYDWFGSRLVGIGSAEISYGGFGFRILEFRVNRVGDLVVTYDRAGTRMCSIGSRSIDFDYGNRVRRVGDWEVTYDRHGYRPTRIGPFEVGYTELRRTRGRLRTVGPLAVGYDDRGVRPITLTSPGDAADLSEDLLVTFFIVRHLVQRPKSRYQPTELLLRALPSAWRSGARRLLRGVVAGALGLMSLFAAVVGIAGFFKGYPLLGALDLVLGAVGLRVAVQLARENRRPRT